MRLFRREIVKFLQHLLSGAQIKRRLHVRIGEPVARHQNAAESRVLRIHEMHVAGGAHRLFQFFAELQNGAVIVPQLFLVGRGAVAQHKGVVADRLHL